MEENNNFGEFKINPNLRFNSHILKYDQSPGKVAEIYFLVLIIKYI